MKGTMKKLAITWFVLCMVCVLQQNVVVQAETLTEGDYQYEVLEDGTAKITKYTGTATTLTIPEKLGGKDVTQIAEYAFFEASTITTVNFPDTLTHIGNWNFDYVTSVHIPASVISIDSRAFGTKYVETITVDENNTVYDSRNDCNAIIKEGIDSETNMSEVSLIMGCNSTVIPEDVTIIDYDAFSACSMESIRIPYGVKEIRYCAFYNCDGLTEVRIPGSVQKLGYAFVHCDNLKKVYISEGCGEIWGAFEDCPQLMDVTIPSTVYRIAEGSFSKCRGRGVLNAEEGSYAYLWFFYAIDYECELLEDGNLMLTRYTGGSSRTNFTIPDTVGRRRVVAIGDNAFEGTTRLSTVTIPKSVERIGEYAFADCTRLREIILGGVTEIDDYAFYGCKRLLEIVLPRGAVRIGDSAFAECGRLQRVFIPASVKEIADTAFAECNKEELVLYVDKDSYAEDWVELKDYMYAIVQIEGDYQYAVLENDTAMILNYIGAGKEIIIPDLLGGKNVSVIGRKAFLDCETATKIIIPTGVTGIEYSAFKNCSSLEEITIPNGVTSIESSTFADCSSLEEITIPDGVTSIVASAFANCSSLEEITIPSTVTSIDYEFGDMGSCPTDMTIYTVPDSYAAQWAEETEYAKGYILPEDKCKVKVLSNDAAAPTVSYTEATDKSATKITVPNQVTVGDVTYKVVEIADNAFSDCTSLEEVVLPETLEKIDSEAFSGLTDEQGEPDLKVTIPEKLEDVSEIGIEKITNIQYIIIYVVEGGKVENYFRNYENITVNVYPPADDKKDDKPAGDEKPSTGDKPAEDKPAEDKPADNQQPSTEQQPPADQNTEATTEAKQEQPAVPEEPTIGKKYTVKNLEYKVTSSKNVTVVGATKKTITKVTIPAKVTILGKSFKVTAVGKKAFKSYSKLKTVVVGSNVKTIGDEAFMKCKKLNKITIGKNVKTIGKKAFYGDKKLKNITFKGTKVTKIGKKAMKGVSGVKIKVPTNKAKKKYEKLLKNAQ